MTTQTPRHARHRKRDWGLHVCPICWTRYWRLSRLKTHWYAEHDV